MGVPSADTVAKPVRSGITLPATTHEFTILPPCNLRQEVHHSFAIDAGLARNIPLGPREGGFASGVSSPGPVSTTEVATLGVPLAEE